MHGVTYDTDDTHFSLSASSDVRLIVASVCLCINKISQKLMNLCKFYSRHFFYTILKTINFRGVQITFKVAKNEWPKICNLYTSHVKRYERRPLSNHSTCDCLPWRLISTSLNAPLVCVVVLAYCNAALLLMQ